MEKGKGKQTRVKQILNNSKGYRDKFYLSINDRQNCKDIYRSDTLVLVLNQRFISYGLERIDRFQKNRFKHQAVMAQTEHVVKVDDFNNDLTAFLKSSQDSYPITKGCSQSVQFV